MPGNCVLTVTVAVEETVVVRRAGVALHHLAHERERGRPGLRHLVAPAGGLARDEDALAVHHARVRAPACVGAELADDRVRERAVEEFWYIRDVAMVADQTRRAGGGGE